MEEYRFLTVWRIEASIDRVYAAILDSLQWPEWWPGVDRVEELATGEDGGTGNVRRYVWKGRLPYRIRFDARTTRVEPEKLLEASISGDLEGTGRWIFRQRDGVTTVFHEWNVCTTRQWMNLIAPLARQLFTDNHRWLMTQGIYGLAQCLDSRVLRAAHRGTSSAVSSPASDAPGHWLLRAVVAGLIGGIAATMLQIALWPAAGLPVLATLLRDSRMAAALLLGKDVLATGLVDSRILLAAGAVHFFLSAVYGVMLGIVGRLRGGQTRVVAGAVFGLLLYATNMYGFTEMFPWFAASRDWVTLAAHVCFGITAALLCARDGSVDHSGRCRNRGTQSNRPKLAPRPDEYREPDA